MQKVLITAIIAIAVSVVSARAEEAGKITVNGAGSVKILPTALEVMVALKEKGETPPAAADALKLMRDKVAEKFKEKFKVAADAIKDDELHVTDMEQLNRNRQQMRARTGGRLAKKKDEAKKIEVEVTQLLRVRIPLSGKDVNAITLEAEDIKVRVKAEVARLIEKSKEDGKEEGAENSEPDPEELQNAAASAFHYMFFAPRSEDNYNKALADALQKAKESSARMAKVMGKTADLHSVNMVSDGTEEAYAAARYYNRYNDPYQNGNSEQFSGSSDPDGITSATPAMSMSARISAEFMLK